MGIKIQDQPVNDLAPVSIRDRQSRIAFWNGALEAIALGMSMRPELQMEFPSLFEGMFADRPNFCIADVAEVSAWKASQPRARDKWATGANLFGALRDKLYPRSLRRITRDLFTEHPWILEIGTGLDIATLQTVFGLIMNRLFHEANERGHSRQTREIIVMHEGALLFSDSLEYAIEGNVSFQRRAITMGNSIGLCFVTLFQSFSTVPSWVLNNAGTFCVFRMPNKTEADYAAQILGGDEELALDLVGLPAGVSWIKSVGWERPTKCLWPKLF